MSSHPHITTPSLPWFLWFGLPMSYFSERRASTACIELFQSTLLGKTAVMTNKISQYKTWNNYQHKWFADGAVVSFPSQISAVIYSAVDQGKVWQDHSSPSLDTSQPPSIHHRQHYLQLKPAPLDTNSLSVTVQQVNQQLVDRRSCTIASRKDKTQKASIQPTSDQSVPLNDQVSHPGKTGTMCYAELFIFS